MQKCYQINFLLGSYSGVIFSALFFHQVFFLNFFITFEQGLAPWLAFLGGLEFLPRFKIPDHYSFYSGVIEICYSYWITFYFNILFMAYNKP